MGLVHGTTWARRGGHRRRLHFGPEAPGLRVRHPQGPQPGHRQRHRHRPHDGGDPGKGTGVCKGKGGSMHIASPDINYFATSGILGASSVIANGAALTIKKRNERDRITAVFTATAPQRGACFEALNLAALWASHLICVHQQHLRGNPPIAKVCTTPIFPKACLPLWHPRNR